MPVVSLNQVTRSILKNDCDLASLFLSDNLKPFVKELDKVEKISIIRD